MYKYFAEEIYIINVMVNTSWEKLISMILYNT